jgi:hypothetical protein
MPTLADDSMQGPTHAVLTTPCSRACRVVLVRALNQQVKFKSNWNRENLRIVIFVQERKSLRILGAATYANHNIRLALLFN